jgi:hypothetical protein
MALSLCAASALVVVAELYPVRFSPYTIGSFKESGVFLFYYNVGLGSKHGQTSVGDDLAEMAGGDDIVRRFDGLQPYFFILAPRHSIQCPNPLRKQPKLPQVNIKRRPKTRPRTYFVPSLGCCPSQPIDNLLLQGRVTQTPPKAPLVPTILQRRPLRKSAIASKPSNGFRPLRQRPTSHPS